MKDARKHRNDYLRLKQPVLEIDKITDHIIEWSIAHKGPIKREKDRK